MIRSKNQSQFRDALHASFDTSLIEIGAEQIHAIGTPDVVEPVSVHVADPRTVRLLDDGADFEVTLDICLVLKGHAVAIDKSQIRKGSFQSVAKRERVGGTFPEEVGKTAEAFTPNLLNLWRSRIARKERSLSVLVCRNPARYPQSDSGVTLQ